MQPAPIITGVRPLNIPGGKTALEIEPPERQPPIFPRAPREYIPYPDDEITIQMPQAAPSPPTNSLISVFMSVLGAGIMAGFYIYSASNSATGTVPPFAYSSLFIGGLSLIVGLFSYFSGRRKYKQQVELRRATYEQYLSKKVVELDSLVKEQRAASLSAHPDLEQCAQFAAQRTPTRLWERENGDPDFLDIRLGIGEAPATFSVKVPDSSQFQVTPDPLEEKARALVPAFARVEQLAVALPIARLGAAGWVGKREALVNALRASLLHLAAHHAPNEVKIAVLCAEKEASEWDWARWLPHNWSDGREIRFLGADKTSQARVMEFIENILKQRSNQQSPRDASALLPAPVFVIIFADVSLWRGAEAIKFAPALDLILKNGRELGAFPLFISEQISRVPKACKAVVDLGAAPAVLKFLGTNPQKYAFTPDYANRDAAWHFSQSLAPVRLEEAGGGAANLPSQVTLLELVDVSKIEEINLLEIWKQSKPFDSLAVPVGIGAGGKRLLLDLHEKYHGPHGLVAGTTGSGKTALLSTYLALAALYYHPHELGFIGIDFKGGDLIRELKDLPHMIGTLTNLEGSGTDRAIKILRGEIKKRQALFNQAGIGNIYDYQKMRRKQDPAAPQPMPHLVIVCDEFAELKKEQPEFIRELVSISRVGRSLGIHLILATQKPAGVVSDEIWANSHFHLCLKVASLEDSREMLRRSEAAEITQKGRAYFQVGMNEVFELFQAAWGDAPYVPDDALSRQPRIKRLNVYGERQEIWPPKTTQSGTGKTHIQELAAHIIATCQKNNIQRVEGIWPPALSEQAGKTIEAIMPAGIGWNGKTWKAPSQYAQPVLGVKDDPEHQRQELLQIDLENNGHLALFGSPGSGKTTTLQTLVTSLACQNTPEQAQMYLLDYSGRALNLFERLPHVGAVINNGENERLRRLFTLLSEEMERRKKLIEHDQNLVNYRKSHPNCREPEILVVLDGYSHFAEAFKNQMVMTEVDYIVRLASQGGALGIHLVIATDQVKSFPAKLLGNIKDVITTELNDANDYVSVIGRTGGLFPPKDSPGRGLLKGAPVMEFQTALPAPSPLELKMLVDEMDRAWQGGRPRLVPVLPDVISLSDFLTPGMKQTQPQPGLPVPIALDLSKPDLQSFEISLASGPHFWVAGLPQSGKTSLLQTWLLALANCYAPDLFRFYLVDLGWGSLETIKTLPHAIGCITDVAEFRTFDLKEQLADLLNIDFNGPKPVAMNTLDKPTVVFAVDGLGALQKGLSGDKTAEKNRDFLLSLLRVKNAHFHMLASGAATEFSGGMLTNPLGETLRGFQSGFWLGDGTNADANNFNFQFLPGDTIKGLPKGAAFSVNRGRYTPLKLATCQVGSPALGEWMQTLQP